MATTTPDNLWSPNASDPYNLTVDLATMQSTTQLALNEKSTRPVTAASIGALPAGEYPGQFAWVTSPAPGFIVHWTGSAWVRDTPEDTGWVNVTIASGFAGLGGVEAPAVRRIGKQVFMRGGWSNTGIVLNSSNTVGTLPSSQFWPVVNSISRTGTSVGAAAASGFVVASNGSVQIRTNGTGSTYYSFSPTWLVD